MFFVRGLICFFGVVLIVLVMALIAAKINELNAKAELTWFFNEFLEERN